MNRRYFLLMGLIVAAGTSTAGLLHWLGLRPAESSSTPENDSPEKQVADETATSAEAPLFPEEDHVYLLAMADIIVPREGDLPSASDIDIIARLEELAHSSESRLRVYRKGWPKLRILLRLVKFKDDKLDSEVLEQRMRKWSNNFRTKRRVPRKAIPFFELMRRDILALYYSTPSGWSSVGYTGPIHRMNSVEGQMK